MAIYQIKQVKAGRAQGEGSAASTYHVTFIAWSNSADDDAGEVIQAMQALGYNFGTIYSQPGYSDPTSYLETIAPVFRQDSADPWLWDVTLTYEPPRPPEKREDADLEPVEDPEEWQLELREYQVPRTVPAWGAWNADAFPRPPAPTWDHYVREAGTFGPIVASDGTVYDPAPDRVLYDSVFRISGYALRYDQKYTRGVVGMMNSTAMRWNPMLAAIYSMQNEIFEPWTVLIQAAEAEYRVINNGTYWRYTYDFAIRPRDYGMTEYGPSTTGDGWLETILDRGLQHITTPGSPGGQDSGQQLPADTSPRSAIRDHDGKRTPELAMLDGRGGILDLTGESHSKTGVWFRWRIHEETEMFAADPKDNPLALHIFDEVPAP